MPKTFGLVLVGMVAALMGMLLCAIFVALQPGDIPHLVAARAAVGSLAGFCFIAAEALVRARPWFFRASVALVGAYALTVLVLCILTAGVAPGILATIMVMVFSSVIIIPILAYVLGEKQRLSGRTHVPVHRPWPVPGQFP
ncbi:MAG: hypothetical protein JO306_02835 [Gemmatimonadetes bacterium]|nr:hypothetical protein [Gemmatimonadota bacterium]